MSFSSKQIFHLDYNNQRRLCCYCDICFSYIAYPRLRQNMLQSVLLVIALIAFASGMPYQVPMQGKAGGKRTLIILDDVSSGNSYSLFFEALESRYFTPRCCSLSSSNEIVLLIEATCLVLCIQDRKSFSTNTTNISTTMSSSLHPVWKKIWMLSPTSPRMEVISSSPLMRR
jgi:hypothetical protein